MAKFHISDSGEPKRCIARPGNCKYREADGSEVEHYATKEEAREAYERAQEAEAVPAAESTAGAEAAGSSTPFLSSLSGVPDLNDVIGQEKIQARLDLIREHMTEAVLDELKQAPEGSQGYYYMVLVGQRERGELTEGQFANLATARAGSAVARASSTVQAVVEREILERHMVAMRDEYSAAISDVADQMEPGRSKPGNIEHIFEREFKRSSYGPGSMDPEERRKELAAARRELQIFGPLAERWG